MRVAEPIPIPRQTQSTRRPSDSRRLGCRCIELESALTTVVDVQARSTEGSPCG
jgi:hypothetical protein